MTVTITITSENPKQVIADLCGFLQGSLAVGTTLAEKEPLVSPALVAEAKAILAEIESKPLKEKKAKVEKLVEAKEVKAEVLAPEKPKYTLQDAIDRAREIAGDGQNEKVMTALKGINTRLGISKVREIPPEKLDGYMVELEKEFPKDAAKPADANMFD